MLVLSRKKGESIIVGEDIVVKVIDIRDDQIRIGVSAPRDVVVDREEVYEAKKRQKESESE